MSVSRINFPGEVLGLAADFFERLINRHGADGHGRVAENPFARGVDVLAGGQIHDGVRAPLGGPAHLLDFLLDARRDGAVADVGVDLHEEVAPDDHRLALGMIDVGRDDGAAAGDFGADELGRDGVGMLAPKDSPPEIACCVLRVWVKRMLAPEVFADGDELHFRRDDALAGVMQLRDRPARPWPAEPALALDADWTLECRCERRCDLDLWTLDLDFFDVAARQNPGPAQRGRPLLDVAIERGIAPRAGAIIDAHGFIGLDAAVERLGRAELDFAEGHANRPDESCPGRTPARNWAAGHRSAVQKTIFVAIIHLLSVAIPLPRELVEASVPFASITWSRFNGSAANPPRHSQPSPRAMSTQRWLAPL